MRSLESRDVARSILGTATQVVVTGAVFFLLYRYLYAKLGVEQIGIWSLVLASASLSRLADLGMSGAVVKFIAQSLARQDLKEAADRVQTTVVSLTVSIAAFSLLAYPLLVHGMPFLLRGDAALAIRILPFALLSFGLSTVGGIFLSALDGCQRIDLRCLLVSLSHTGYLALALLWVPSEGLMGVAYAQTTHTAALCIAAWLLLRLHIPSLPILPIAWQQLTFKALLSFGVKLQAASLLGLAFDVVTKTLVSIFGGLSALGYYEMANKLVLQVRALVVEANRTMVPIVSHAVERTGESAANSIFVVSYRAVFSGAVVIYTVCAIAIPTISVLWIGRYDQMFVGLTLLLIGGWFVNTLAAPTFFSNIGTGRVNANVVSHLAMVVSGTPLAAILGKLFGVFGVVLGAMTGLACGSMFLFASFKKLAGSNSYAALLPVDLVPLVVVSLFGIGLANGIGLVAKFSMFTLLVSLACASLVLYQASKQYYMKELFQAFTSSK